MTAARPAPRSLYNILREERTRGFDDTAVIGGLDGFLVRNASELEPYLGGISSYASLTSEERSEWSRQTVQRIRKATGATEDQESDSLRVRLGEGPFQGSSTGQSPRANPGKDPHPAEPSSCQTTSQR